MNELEVYHKIFTELDTFDLQRVACYVNQHLRLRVWVCVCVFSLWLCYLDEPLAFAVSLLLLKISCPF